MFQLFGIDTRSLDWCHTHFQPRTFVWFTIKNKIPRHALPLKHVFMLHGSTDTYPQDLIRQGATGLGGEFLRSPIGQFNETLTLSGALLFNIVDLPTDLEVIFYFKLHLKDTVLKNTTKVWTFFFLPVLRICSDTNEKQIIIGPF